MLCVGCGGPQPHRLRSPRACTRPAAAEFTDTTDTLYLNRTEDYIEVQDIHICIYYVYLVYILLILYPELVVGSGKRTLIQRNLC